MEDGAVLTLVSDSLTIKDVVSLGSCSRYHERTIRGILEIRMRKWKEKLAAEKLDLFGDNNQLTLIISPSADDPMEEFRKGQVKLQLYLFHEMEFDAHYTALSKSSTGLDALNCNFGRASQGGTIFLSSLHYAAAVGDADLCSLLLSRGASVNPNISIPNDGDSIDKGVPASNRNDGTDASQYRWGLITPLRLAVTFGLVEVAELLRSYGGEVGNVVEVICNGDALPVTLSFRIMDCKCRERGLGDLRHLADGSCWVRETNDEIYYLNTFIDNDSGNVEAQHHVLFCKDLLSSRVALLGCGHAM